MRIIFNHRRRSEDGQALLLSVLLIALIAIMIPAINSVLQLRNQWTTSSLDSNMALRAAYAGVAQASSLLGATLLFGMALAAITIPLTRL